MAAGADLTQTATAGAGPARPPPSMPPRIGRYIIERIVGVGGMGVVYAGFDPDLERRVAVKVLRVAEAGVDHRARLLREARAMAKLAHANVITVHEVGTDGEVDFIAMELIDGDNLAVWLREGGPRSRVEVLRAFREAGQALAAAHAAGLVHRDFKPHNVLIGRDGRVVVTDFGLARVVDSGDDWARPDADLTRPGSLRSGLTATDTALTRTGALIGTPAYMPPEQFDGGSGEPSADQFSFCVAVWEGLTGARPFVGDSVDELHRAVLSGLSTASGRGLPRRLRAVLARGLDADPARRWPSMSALLSALARAVVRPRRIATAAVAAAIIAAIGIVVLWPRITTPACAVDAGVIDGAWSAERRAALASEVAAVVGPVFDRARRDWETARTAVCAGSDQPSHGLRAACLDDASAALAAVVTATSQVDAALARAGDVAGMVPEPAVCLAAVPPAVPATTDAAALAATRAAVATLMLDARRDAVADDDPRIAALLAPGAAGGCAARVEAAVGATEAIAATVLRPGSQAAHAAEARARARAESAAIDAGRCGHDLAEASALVIAVEQAGAGRQASDAFVALLSRARAAVERAGRPATLAARLEVVDAAASTDRNHFDQALQLLESASARLAATGRTGDANRVALEAVRVLLLRSGPGDLADADRRARAAVDELRALLGGGHRRVIAALQWLAQVQWYRGANEEFAALRAEVRAAPRRRPAADPGPALVHHAGRVVDVHGRPVAGATVAASPLVVADASFLGPFDFGQGGIFELRETRTDADGVFGLDAPPGSMVVAALDDARSRPVLAAADLTLRLESSGRIAGAVDFVSPRRGLMSVGAMVLESPLGPGFVQLAPIASDGSFVLDRVPPGRYDVWLQRGDTRGARLTGREVEVSAAAPVSGLELRWHEGAVTLEVLLRANRGELDVVQITVVHGAIEADTWAELSAAIEHNQDTRIVAVDRADVEATARGRELGADLVARVDGLDGGSFTVCATPLTGHLVRSSNYRELNAHADRVDVSCQPINLPTTGTHRVTIDVEPMRRLPP